MKSAVKKLLRDETGAAMILALILLLIGGLICAALLGHMGAGLLAGQVYGRRTAELYAADAGVEDAIWKIQHPNEAGYLPCNVGSPPRNYTIIDVNGRDVEVSIEFADAGTYKITSVAITEGNGDGGVAAIDSSTAVESYVSALYMDFSSLLDNAIVSQDTILIKGKTEVNGDVWLADKDEPGKLELDTNATINGEVRDEDDISMVWPTAEQLSSYYKRDMEGAYDPGSFIDIKDLYPQIMGPWYREGSLDVDNTGNPATIVLEGTVYVAGDLDFWQPSEGCNYTIDLNGNTIFTEGSISFASQHISISGSGCIIAVGDINFQPAITSGGDNFVLVMSITGQTYFHPSGEFTGCVVGNTHVQLQPGCTINWVSPEGKGLNFPGADGGEEPVPVAGVKIESWEVIQQ